MIESETLPRIEVLATIAPERLQHLLRRGQSRLRELRAPVNAILEDVRARGDAAVLEYASRFDTLPARLRVPDDEITIAVERCASAYPPALRQAADAIQSFHEAQKPATGSIETTPGVRVWRVWRPLERIGIYVPGGGALYPSCLLMAAIPARIAGCQQIVVCTPPGKDGHVPAPVLAAAALAGVTEVYAVGGVQAIGALAYGTETIRQVDKIVGPGNSYVATAKALVASEVAIDLPAGPSEVLIVADASAHPAWAAADLLAQAEHGPESACVLVTDSPELADAVQREIARQIERLPTRQIIHESLSRNGAILVARGLDEALAFANQYAAEHLELMVRDAATVVERISHAGSVFLGGWSAVAAGDYATGGNHTLPTAGYARGFGPLAVETFGRLMQVQQVEPAGLNAIGDSIQTLANTEGLTGHAASIAIRLVEKRAHDESEGIA